VLKHDNEKKRKREDENDENVISDNDETTIANDDDPYEFHASSDETSSDTRPTKRRKKIKPIGKKKKPVKKVTNRNRPITASPRPKQIGEEDTNPISIESDDEGAKSDVPATSTY
jgi:hypothetical protein